MELGGKKGHSKDSQIRGAITVDGLRPLWAGSARRFYWLPKSTTSWKSFFIQMLGGSPMEAECISDMVHLVRDKSKMPMTAMIGGLGASAGYMVAVSADQIVSGNYSLVGSIGAVTRSWQIEGLLERFDVKAK